MKHFGRALVLMLTMLLLPAAHAVDVGSGIGINMGTEKFPPAIWICDHRIVLDDSVEPGRTSEGGKIMVERIENYAFEGEQIEWGVLVMDKNGIDKVQDVYMTVGEKQSGRLERICVLPNKQIVINGNLTESDWKKAFTVSGACSYNVFINNDYHNLFVAFQKVSGCTGSTFSMSLNTTAGIVTVLDKASEHVLNSNNTVAEYKIPLSSLGLSQGQAIRLAVTAFGSGRFPATGWQSFSLEAEKCHMERVYNSIEANCQRVHDLAAGEQIDASCNAKVLEETFRVVPADGLFAYYKCIFTVETANSMYGQYFVVPEAEDLDGLKTPADENEYWYFNPGLALVIDGMIDFGTVRPGATSYSDTITVGNGADSGSGVLLDMFIDGTDFYDPAHSGAKCPTTNQLALSNYRYFATHGAYGTQNFPVGPKTCIDDEGYSLIPSGNKISQAKEIIGCRAYNADPAYQPGNVLSPGAEMSLTFRLNLPEPCNGDFSEGNIFFWGEAV